MKRAKQLLIDDRMKLDVTHGGDKSRGKRKIARPIATKRAMHLVMRAFVANLLVPRNARIVRDLLSKLSRRHFVRVHEFSNNGNHLHLLVQAKTRDGFKAFLREFAGAIPMRVTGACKGNALHVRFWECPAFTRIVECGRDFRGVVAYIVMNQFEAAGILRRSERSRASRTVPSRAPCS
jgi:REP element-mobilizing transposase RayT